MQTFLDKLSGYIFENYNSYLDKICVVVPNRRAGLFLKKGLANQSKKIIWLPQIFSIEDFITEYSGLSIIDPLYLQCELYNVHKEIERKAPQSFGEFLKWGQVLLNDFNEIDMYLVSPDQLFGYLTETKALTLWNPGQSSLTDFQVKYLKFYNSLRDYHQLLVHRLLEKKQVYHGLAYRYLAENIEKRSSELDYHKIIFAGFNALTKAEEKIISHLEKSGLAEVIWDADTYYIENEIQEAGRFIRNYMKKYPSAGIKWVGNYLNDEGKEIQIIGVPQQVGQAKVTGQILKEFAESSKDTGETAVVLNDESLIEPVLNSIPGSISEYNLTMGLPLVNSAMFRLIKLIIELQINAVKFKIPTGKNVPYYFRDILNVLEHPYIRLVMKNPGGGDIASLILKSNKVFLDYNEILTDYCSGDEQINSLCISLFLPWNDNPGNALKQIIEVIRILKIHVTDQVADSEASENKPELIIEYLFHFSRILNKLKKLIAEYSYLDNIVILRDMFFNIACSINLPFYGEPLRGLQVMGMLETRNLDFRNLIMLSVNDDFIPSGKTTNSFIPFDIKRDFQLPTHRERNAVFAYHFYRILQRSKQVYLLYNTEPGELGGGDKSRFILQIQNELAKTNPAIKIQEKILSVPVGKKDTDTSIVIDKSAEILEILNTYLRRGCSASALNIYRSCSLRFYFRYIVGLEEAEKTEETIETSTLGTVIHDVLKKLYAPLKHKIILPSDIESMAPEVKGMIVDSFKSNYSGGDINFGKNLLIVRVANILINKFLGMEIKFINNLAKTGHELIIMDVEREYDTGIQISPGDLTYEFRLKGIFDRIDSVGDILRIIDYKTGKVLKSELKFNNWEDLMNETKLEKCFQLLFYSYIYRKSNTADTFHIKPGIISLRNLNKGFLNVEVPEKTGLSDEVFLRFESILKEILLDMINPAVSFSQTSKEENCSYCPYRSVCNRN